MLMYVGALTVKVNPSKDPLLKDLNQNATLDKQGGGWIHLHQLAQQMTVINIHLIQIH